MPRMRLGATIVVALLVLSGCSGSSSTVGTDAPPTSIVDASSAATDPTESPGESTADPPREPLPQLEPVVVPPWVPATRSEELTYELSSGAAPTVQQVVDAYDATIASMPGATQSDLPPGDGFGGTYLFGLVELVRDRLTSEQLAVVDANAPEPAPGRVAAGFGRSHRAAPDPVAERYLPVLQKVIGEWRAHRPDLVLPPIRLGTTPRDHHNYLMIAQPVRDAGVLQCHITMYPLLYNGADPPDFVKLVFAHELFHCIQFVWAGGALSAPQWVIEGSADFAANDLYRGTFDQGASFQTEWFAEPNKPLGGRAYDAWPLYEIVRSSGADPYPVIRAMLTAGFGPTVPGTVAGGVDALLAAGGIHDLPLRMNWSAMTLRASAFGSAFWRMSWPVPGGAGGPYDNVSLVYAARLGEFHVAGGAEYSQPQIRVDMPNEIGLVFVATTDSPMTTHAESGTVTVPEQASGRFCFDLDGCRCPDGTSSGAVPMFGRQMIFSYPASREATTSAVQAVEWDPAKYCDVDDRRRAEVNGDPHLVSFDGLPFDVMALGEFVAARDTAGGFEVQTRFVPAAEVGASTSAVAVGDGEHRLTFTAPDLRAETEIAVRLDGVVVGGDATVVAGTMTATPNGSPYDWTIEWADGTTVELWWAQGWFLGLDVAGDRAARLVGLLSAPNHDLADDLRLPDGSVVDPRSAADIDLVLAPSWQVDGATSLFDYAAGEGTATFIGPPASAPVVPSEEALASCVGALGDAASTFDIESCVFDVTATGSSTFVFDYTRVSTSRDEAQVPPLAPLSEENAVDEPGPAPPVPADGDEPLLTLSGTLSGSSGAATDVDAVRELTGTVTLAEGAVVVAKAAACAVDVDSALVLVHRSSGALASAQLCDARGTNGASAGPEDEVVNGEAYLWVSQGGAYDVRVTTEAQDASLVTVQLYSDATPTLVTADDALRDGYRGSLDGIADTVVLLVDTGTESVTWSTAGVPPACAIAAYGGGPLGERGAFTLGVCGHPSTIGIGPTLGQVVPIMVFSRTSATTEIELIR